MEVEAVDCVAVGPYKEVLFEGECHPYLDHGVAHVDVVGIGDGVSDKLGPGLAGPELTEAAGVKLGQHLIGGYIGRGLVGHGKVARVGIALDIPGGEHKGGGRVAPWASRGPKVVKGGGQDPGRGLGVFDAIEAVVDLDPPTGVQSLDVKEAEHGVKVGLVDLGIRSLGEWAPEGALGLGNSLVGEEEGLDFAPRGETGTGDFQKGEEGLGGEAIEGLAVDATECQGREEDALRRQIGVEEVDGGNGRDGGEANVEGGAKAFDVDPDGLPRGGGAKEVNHVLEGIVIGLAVLGLGVENVKVEMTHGCYSGRRTYGSIFMESLGSAATSLMVTSLTVTSLSVTNRTTRLTTRLSVTSLT